MPYLPNNLKKSAVLSEKHGFHVSDIASQIKNHKGQEGRDTSALKTLLALTPSKLVETIEL
jgi:hypothetical protein